MRDHRELIAFRRADELAKLVYEVTRTWPKDELFGLTSQVRRGAVSVASNIVEGCARESKAEYRRFLVIAHSAARELDYQVSLAIHLGYLTAHSTLLILTDEVCRLLAGLLKSLPSSPHHS